MLGDKCPEKLTYCYSEINAPQRGRVPGKARGGRPGFHAVVFRGGPLHLRLLVTKVTQAVKTVRGPSV